MEHIHQANLRITNACQQITIILNNPNPVNYLADLSLIWNQLQNIQSESNIIWHTTKSCCDRPCRFYNQKNGCIYTDSDCAYQHTLSSQSSSPTSQRTSHAHTHQPRSISPKLQSAPTVHKQTTRLSKSTVVTTATSKKHAKSQRKQCRQQHNRQKRNTNNNNDNGRNPNPKRKLRFQSQSKSKLQSKLQLKLKSNSKSKLKSSNDVNGYQQLIMTTTNNRRSKARCGAKRRAQMKKWKHKNNNNNYRNENEEKMQYDKNTNNNDNDNDSMQLKYHHIKHYYLLNSETIRATKPTMRITTNRGINQFKHRIHQPIRKYLKNKLPINVYLTKNSDTISIAQPSQTRHLVIDPTGKIEMNMAVPAPGDSWYEYSDIPYDNDYESSYDSTIAFQMTHV